MRDLRKESRGQGFSGSLKVPALKQKQISSSLQVSHFMSHTPMSSQGSWGHRFHNRVSIICNFRNSPFSKIPLQVFEKCFPKGTELKEQGDLNWDTLSSSLHGPFCLVLRPQAKGSIFWEVTNSKPCPGRWLQEFLAHGGTQWMAGVWAWRQWWKWKW